MKTNHRRGFKSNVDRPQGAIMVTRSAKLAPGEAASVSTPNDFTDGHRGESRAKRGMKDRLHSLTRLAGKRQIRREVDE